MVFLGAVANPENIGRVNHAARCIDRFLFTEQTARVSFVEVKKTYNHERTCIQKMQQAVVKTSSNLRSRQRRTSTKCVLPARSSRWAKAIVDAATLLRKSET